MRVRDLAIAALCAAFVSPPAHAQNGSIQLMPPTYYGTATPCVSSTSPNNQILFLGSTGQGQQSAINCLTGNGFVVNPANSFVGIGTATPSEPLDIAGPVRPYDAANTACTADTAGAIRYNPTTNIHEGCVSVSGNWQWQPFGNACGNLGYAAFQISDVNGPSCQAVCPEVDVAYSDFKNQYSLGHTDYTGHWITTAGTYTIPNGSLGQNFPANPNINTNALGFYGCTINGTSGMGTAMYLTCTPQGWKSTILGPVADGSC